jgi:anti-anti-sigma factor
MTMDGSITINGHVSHDAHGCVNVDGEVDAAVAPEMLVALTRAATLSGCARPRADLRGVTMFSAAGITALVSASQQTPLGIDVDCSPAVDRVLRMCGISRRDFAREPAGVPARRFARMAELHSAAD